MAEILSYAEIEQRYDGQWVIIASTKMNDDLEVLAGEVLAHSQSEVEIYQMLPLAREREVAIEYMGKVPDDVVFML